MVLYNPWHGCHKISEGCRHCYVYRMDAQYNRDSSIVKKNRSFELPLRLNRQGNYIIPSGELVYTCFSSDFLVEDADAWRNEVWRMMKIRSDLTFIFLTKRISRLQECLPEDWNEGYPNVVIGCTVENQKEADARLPIFINAPLQHRIICCEPLLEAIDLSPYLSDKIQQVLAGGESGPDARPCDYQWVLSLREQAISKNISFHYHQTGANLIKDGVLYKIPRKNQSDQAMKAKLDWSK
ncbi:MAG: bacteriophage protein gp37 [Erysipelotrichaceae bacterium]|nr:MAG: bacteriophage protein [Erysipelotrichaceae bacterium]TXT18080.1 MAG: bacteriophage protein gp37 [Erysipelotrichaceae bacterium]